MVSEEPMRKEKNDFLKEVGTTSYNCLMNNESFLLKVLAVTILVSVVMEGCAVQYYDKATQTEHLWGIGHFKMQVKPPNEGVQAIVKGNEVLGVSVKVGADDYHMLFGWNRTAQMSVVSEGASVRLEWPTSDMFSVRVGSRPPFLPDSSILDSDKKTPKKGED